jgi:hypothetical protein
MEKVTGIKQYTISRFISGRKRKMSADILAVCKHAGIPTHAGIESRAEDARLHAALSKVLDGTVETTELIASLIESLGPVVRTLTRHRAKPKSGD